ncbi:sn-glycerol-1-phosphate dehydrogenase [Paenibacillus sp. 1P07SE]|uniref:sn-glycerol-1-phosphate dehydrogenase n=1 Tax=Paenibacillus sp. 1P07SE TaxID=3132209 RepID=UPI0039A4C299
MTHDDDITMRLDQLGLTQSDKQSLAMTIRIEAGALTQAAQYVKERGCRTVLLAVDDRTYEAAGRRLEQLLAAAGTAPALCAIRPLATGDVVADETSVVQLLLEAQRSQAELILAVGGGTIHDLVRYVAYTTHVPFLSIPTAASVDGFTSLGAPLLIRGHKLTIPAARPVALFADLDILTRAPQELAAAGFGDMLGKYTSLFDWRFGSWTSGEAYLAPAAELTRQALEDCIRHTEAIRRRDETGIAMLMRSLVESGLAMRLFGQSHPASGAEHHLSHYWELAHLRAGKRQLLHGAKVGAATVEISRLYRRLIEDGWYDDASTGRPELQRHRPEIGRAVRAIPEPAGLQELLRQVGAPAAPSELGLENGLIQASLREAHLIRPERATLLRLYNESNMKERIQNDDGR